MKWYSHPLQKMGIFVKGTGVPEIVLPTALPWFPATFQCSILVSPPWGIRGYTAISPIANTSSNPRTFRYSSTRTPPSFCKAPCGNPSLCLRNSVAGDTPAPTMMKSASIVSFWPSLLVSSTPVASLGSDSEAMILSSWLPRWNFIPWDSRDYTQR